MQKIYLLLLFFYPILSFSQINVGKSKQTIKKEITKFQKNNLNYKITITEYDSAFLISESDPEKNSINHSLQFDKAGICKLEVILLNCDSCFNNELKKILLLEKYRWKKINENQYISKYEDKLMIELMGENKPKSISIIRMDWSKLIYDMLKGI